MATKGLTMITQGVIEAIAPEDQDIKVVIEAAAIEEVQTIARLIKTAEDIRGRGILVQEVARKERDGEIMIKDNDRTTIAKEPKVATEIRGSSLEHPTITKPQEINSLDTHRAL